MPKLAERELLLRRELYSLCNRAAIIFTILVFLILPALDMLQAGGVTMKFTLSWLKEHLDTDASLAEIADS